METTDGTVGGCIIRPISGFKDEMGWEGTEQDWTYQDRRGLDKQGKARQV